MPTPQQMRTALKEEYPTSENWQERVDKMTDNQVIAILMRIRLKKSVPQQRRP